jgi:trk system potassium uptake protein TrkA
MKQFVIIGLGKFNQGLAEELLLLPVELIIVDRDESLIDYWKERVAACFIADVSDVNCLKAIIPENVAGIVIDLGDSRETSILVTHKLKQLGHNNIVVRAESVGHAEVVTLLGAKKVIFPDREAAKRLVPSLLSNGLISFTPIGSNFAFAELASPDSLIGKTLVEMDFRRTYNLNLIAVRSFGHDSNHSGDGEFNNESNYQLVNADYRFESDTVLLVSGTEISIRKFAEKYDYPNSKTSFRDKVIRFFHK